MAWSTSIAEEALLMLRQGGVVLWMLLALGMLLYGILASTWIALLQVGNEVKTMRFSGRNRRELGADFAVQELDSLAWVERRIPVLGVLIGAAPLMGLLGTVSGMLVTFVGLASSGQTSPIDKIAVGISEALVTTQAGLLIAVPALIVFTMLKRKVDLVQAGMESQLRAESAAVLSEGGVA